MTLFIISRWMFLGKFTRKTPCPFVAIKSCCFVIDFGKQTRKTIIGKLLRMYHAKNMAVRTKNETRGHHHLHNLQTTMERFSSWLRNRLVQTWDRLCKLLPCKQSSNRGMQRSNERFGGTLNQKYGLSFWLLLVWKLKMGSNRFGLFRWEAKLAVTCCAAFGWVLRRARGCNSWWHLQEEKDQNKTSFPNHQWVQAANMGSEKKMTHSKRNFQTELKEVE